MPIDPSLITDTLSRWQSPQFAFPDPLAQYAKIQALKNGIMQQQTDALDLQQKQKAIADQAAIDKAFADSRTTDAAGNVTYDRNKVLANVPGSHVATIQKTFNDADESLAKLTKAKDDAAEASNNLAASYLLGAHDTKYDPDATRAIVTEAVGKGVLPQADGARILQQINQNPTPQGIEAVLAPFMARSPGVQKTLNDRKEAQAKADTVGVEQAKEQRVKDQDFINSLGSAQNPDQYAALIAQGSAKGITPSVISAAPSKFDPAAVQQYAQQTLTSKDRAEIAQRGADAAAAKAAHDETARHNRVDESIQATRNQLQQTAARGDRSYQSATHELDQIGKPVTDAVARLGKLQDTLAQNSPQADALVAPELLSVMAGGAGSGLRMNESEIARVIGGRSKWQDLQAAVNKWQLDPTKANSITPEQRSQIRSLTQVVSDKLYAKQNALDAAYKTVAGSQDPNDHRQAVLAARQAITNVDSAGAGAQPAWNPPAGATFQHNPKTGKERYTTDGGKTWVVQP